MQDASGLNLSVGSLVVIDYGSYFSSEKNLGVVTGFRNNERVRVAVYSNIATPSGRIKAAPPLEVEELHRHHMALAGHANGDISPGAVVIARREIAIVDRLMGNWCLCRMRSGKVWVYAMVPTKKVKAIQCPVPSRLKPEGARQAYLSQSTAIEEHFSGGTHKSFSNKMQQRLMGIKARIDSRHVGEAQNAKEMYERLREEHKIDIEELVNSGTYEMLLVQKMKPMGVTSFELLLGDVIGKYLGVYSCGLNGDSVVFSGESHLVRQAPYMYASLINQIESACQFAWKNLDEEERRARSFRSFAASFAYGCVDKIADEIGQHECVIESSETALVAIGKGESYTRECFYGLKTRSVSSGPVRDSSGYLSGTRSGVSIRRGVNSGASPKPNKLKSGE